MHEGFGKRWLLIGLLVLGGIWLVNDAYDDGYRDALVQTGQVQNVRHYRGGPDFPWGLVILGGIGYVAWRKGAFNRFSGPDGSFNDGRKRHDERGVQRYGNGNGWTQTPTSPSSSQGFGAGFRGPRTFFDDWHRQAHEHADASHTHYPAPPAPPAPPAAGNPAPASSNASPQAGFVQTPPPTPPAPEYWDSMAGTAAGTTEGTSGHDAPLTSSETSEARQDENPDALRDSTGTTR